MHTKNVLKISPQSTQKGLKRIPNDFQNGPQMVLFGTHGTCWTPPRTRVNKVAPKWYPGGPKETHLGLQIDPLGAKRHEILLKVWPWKGYCEILQKSTEPRPPNTSKIMGSSWRNACFPKSAMSRKRPQFDLKMTRKCTQVGPKKRFGGPKSALKSTLKTITKKTPKKKRPKTRKALLSSLRWLR